MHFANFWSDIFPLSIHTHRHTIIYGGNVNVNILNLQFLFLFDLLNLPTLSEPSINRTWIYVHVCMYQYVCAHVCICVMNFYRMKCTVSFYGKIDVVLRIK